MEQPRNKVRTKLEQKKASKVPLSKAVKKMEQMEQSIISY
jgi:hypothetical protein